MPSSMFCLFFTAVCCLLLDNTNAASSEQKKQLGRAESRCHYNKIPFPPSNVMPKIIGGRPAEPKEIPWQAILYKFGRFTCGGSIITNRWVVTAAHCVFSTPDFRHYEVVAGTLNSHNPESTAQCFFLRKLIPHPNHDHFRHINDVALIEIDGVFRINEYVSPISITFPNTNKDVEDIPGIKCNISGWGRTWGYTTYFLRVAEVPLVSKIDCNRSFNTTLTPDVVCAGDKRLTCFGDSGGPLMCKIHEEKNEWFLAGVASFAHINCSLPPGGFARVSYFESWIWRTINSN